MNQMNLLEKLIAYNHNEIEFNKIFQHVWSTNQMLSDAQSYKMVSKNVVYQLARAIEFHKKQGFEIPDSKIKNSFWELCLKELNN